MMLFFDKELVAFSNCASLRSSFSLISSKRTSIQSKTSLNSLAASDTSLAALERLLEALLIDLAAFVALRTGPLPDEPIVEDLTAVLAALVTAFVTDFFFLFFLYSA